VVAAENRRRSEIESQGAEAEEERENNGDGDPVKVLGEDLMMKILARLDARSLARSLLVSRPWFSLASSDSLWSPLVGFLSPLL